MSTALVVQETALPVEEDHFDLRFIAEIIADLSKPLDARHLKTRKQGGTNLTYIEWHTAVKYLDLYASGWSYAVKSVALVGALVTVVASISIPCVEGVVTRESTGCEDEEMKGYGDPCSNAEAMALKRAASKFGLGLYLYDKDGKPAPVPRTATPTSAGTSDPRPKTLGELVTPKQLWMIRQMARETGANVDSLCREKFGCEIAEISKKAASVIIDALKLQGAEGPEVATTEKEQIEQESAKRIAQTEKLRPVAIDAALGGDYDKIGELIVAAELEDASGNRRFVYQQLAKGDFAGMASYLKQTPEYMAEKFKHLAVTASTGPSKDLMRNPNYGPEIAKRFNAVVQQLTIRGIPPDELLREANVCLHDAGRKQIRSRYEADDESARIICDTFEAWVVIHDRKQQESRASQS